MNTPDISRAMKRIVGVALTSALMAVPCTAMAAETGVPLDAAHFPDAAFREVVKQYDTNGDGVFGPEELYYVQVIDEPCYSKENSECVNINSIKGIEYLYNLSYLNLFGSNLTEVDLGQNSELMEINLGNNKLTSIDLTQNSELNIIRIDDNALTEVNLSNQDKVNSLDLSNNNIKNISISKEAPISYLNLSNNELASIDLSAYDNLEQLLLHNNNINKINLDNNKSLKILGMSYNDLSSVDVSQNASLINLDLTGNKLTFLDISKNDMLSDVYLAGNYLLGISDAARHMQITDQNPLAVDGSSLDLMTIAPIMDISRIESIRGGVLKGNMLIAAEDDALVTYTYRLGNTGLRAQIQFENCAMYTVSFNASGGTPTPAMTVRYGIRVQKPKAPTRDGYTFDGWYTEPDGGDLYDFYEPITADVTLYAHWTANAPAISFRDVSSSTPHHEDIQWLADNGISTGWKRADGTYEFRGMSAVVRQDMAAFLRREAKHRGVADAADWKPTDADWKRFRDVNRGTPHAEDILWLAHAGISTGWKERDGSYTFRGMDTVKRQDMAAFLKRLADKAGKTDGVKPKTDFTDVTDRTPHVAEVRWLGGSGISTGYRNADGTWRFEGMTSVYRQDMAAFLHRLDNQLNK